MGLAGKTRRREKKRKAKRAAKAAKKALYASLRGTSKKGKKVRARTRAGISPYKHLHRVEYCGNIGCSRCHPEFVRTILNGRVMEFGKAA